MADSLIDGVQRSQDTAANIKQRTVDILEEARLIHSRVIADNPAAQLEYKEVQLAVMGALADLKNETSAELEAVRGELGDGGNIDPFLYAEGSISEAELVNIETQFKELETIDTNAAWTELPPQLAAIADKNFTEFTPGEAQQMLQFLQGDYRKYSSISNPLDTGLSYNSSYSTESVRMAQETLINIIYGPNTAENGFSGENLVGYASDEGGNYIISVSDFEEKLQIEADINNKVFASYINSVENRCGGDTERFKVEVSRHLGARTERINTFMNKSTDQNVVAAKEKLISLGVFSEEGWIDWFERKLQIDVDTSYSIIEQKITSYTNLADVDTQISTYKTDFENAKGERENIVGKDSAEMIIQHAPILFEGSKGEDISMIENPELQEAVLDERKEEFSEEAQKLKMQVEENFGPLFQGNPEILSYIKESLDTENPKPIDPNEFIAHIQGLIEAHNKKYENEPEKQIQEISNEVWIDFITSINSAKDVNLKSAYTINVGKLSTLSEKMEIIEREQREIRERMKAAEGAELKHLDTQLQQTEEEAQRVTEEMLQVAETQAEVIVAQESTGITSIVLENVPEDTPEEADILEVLETTQASEAVQTQVEIIKKENEARQASVESISTLLQEGKTEEARVAITELQEADNVSYMAGDWDKSIKKAEKSYTTAMISSYGQDWEKKVPLPPKSTEQTLGSSDTWTLNQNASVEIYGDSPAIVLEGGKTYIPITPEEQKTIENNPDALQNMIHFYTFFQKLNLESAWDYREQLVKTMDSVNINLEDDSINPSELVRFGNELIKILNGLLPAGEELHENHANIFSLKAELRRFSESGNFMSGNKSFNKLGEDKFEALMRKYGIIGGAVFRTEELRKATREEGRFSDENIEKQN